MSFIAPQIKKSSELLPGAARKWFWQDYLLSHNITLFFSQYKAGKTTLLCSLLRAMHTPGASLGTAVNVNCSPAPLLYVSEEDEGLWFERVRRFSLLHDTLHWIVTPFDRKMPMDMWRPFIKWLGARMDERACEILVLDTIASLGPAIDENSSRDWGDLLLPLKQLAAGGKAIMLVHHEHKRGKGDIMQDSRGSTHLMAGSDIVVHLTRVNGKDRRDPRRRLACVGRHGFPDDLLLQWNPDSLTYSLLGSAEPSVDGDLGLTRLVQLLPLALSTDPRQWPSGLPRDAIARQLAISAPTARRMLTQATEQGLVAQQGLGTKANPFTYVALQTP